MSQRAAAADEVARVVQFLATERGAFVSGDFVSDVCRDPCRAPTTEGRACLAGAGRPAHEAARAPARAL